MAEAWAASQPRRFTLARIAATGLALLIAGCSTVVPRGHAPTPSQTPSTTQQGPIGPELPSDQERHRIALLVPTTGANAGVGQSIANAVNLAVIDTGGKRIRVTTYDTATGAAAAAQRAISDGNRLILGPLLAEDARAVAPVAQRANVPVISFSNDASVAGRGTYILGYSPVQSIERVVGYAKSRGVVRFAALMPAGTYGERASRAMIHAVENAGGQLVAMQSFDRSRTSLAAAIAKLPKNGYDAIMIADSGRIAIQAVPLIRKGSSASARVLGTELWNTETDLNAAPAMSGAWFASVSDGLYKQLAAKYRARFGSGPYRIASLGYDGVLLVTRIAQNWKVGSAFPVARLNDSGGFAGIDGAFRFDASGQAERMLVVQQVGAGGFTVVSPAPSTFGN
ncbi:MAG: penicillin-binding protein activator [Sphingomonas sanxanigenens]|uniref:Penicillin-binding protein activator n=1 Tax=Sphingomonas sanxanigenens TaxID=397260 RepID=A0A2W5BXD4_9SPHN|nr:MAG: penicillin-binding protein activator [Sphingomonas sanxanigenens]